MNFSVRWPITARRQIRLSCWSASRREAEQALSDGVAEMAICQANNRTLGSEMEWRALGTVDLRFYAADSLFHDSAAADAIESFVDAAVSDAPAQ